MAQRSKVRHSSEKNTSCADSDESHVPGLFFILLVIIDHSFRHSKYELTGNAYGGVNVDFGGSGHVSD